MSQLIIAGLAIIDECLNNLHMIFFLSTGRRTRTHDPRFWRPMLYQLSYSRMKAPTRKRGLEFLWSSMQQHRCSKVDD